jgi:alpha-galactosidase
MENAVENDRRFLLTKFAGALDGGFPSEDAWNHVKSLHFARDWQGKHEDLERETEVCGLWNPQTIFLKFRCRYRTLTTFQDGDASGRREFLWDRDVAEVFIQTDANRPHNYWEFEVSPNGMWIDLEIFPGGRKDARSGMRSRVTMDEERKIWTAVLAIPVKSFTAEFVAEQEWRVNFFRVEGAAEPRWYSSWQPTFTGQPNFHVPEAFGVMRFEKA